MGMTVTLDTTLTPELIEEGFVREIVSKIQTMRKEADFDVMDHIVVSIDANDKVYDIADRNRQSIMTDVLAEDILKGNMSDAETSAEWNINSEKATFFVRRTK